jgi:hypothetical protein
MANKQIRQEINLINRSIADATSGLVLIGSVGMTPSGMNGISAAYLEIIGMNTNTDKNSSIELTLGGTQITYTSMPMNTGSITRFRGPDFKGESLFLDGIWEVNMYTNPTSDGITTIKSAKIIILQDAADITDTQTQIEVGAFLEFDHSDTSLHTLADSSEGKYWKFEASKFDPTPTFTFAVSYLAEGSSYAISFILQESADAAFTSPSEAVAITGLTSEAASYAESALFTPVDGYYYRVAYQQSSSMRGGTIFNAKVIATQSTSVTKLQTEYLLINDAQAGTGLQEFQTSWDPAEWNDGAGGLPTCYHEHSADSGSSNTKLQENIEVIADTLSGGGSYQNLHGGTGTREALNVEFTSAAGIMDLSMAVLSLRKANSPTDNLQLFLRSVDTGDNLASSNIIAGGSMTTSFVDYLFFFSPYELAASSTYYLHLERSGSRDETNNYDWEYQAADLDGSLRAGIQNSGSYGYQTNDFMVKIFMGTDIPNSDITGDDLVRGGSALTMPGSAKEIDSYIITA